MYWITHVFYLSVSSFEAHSRLDPSASKPQGDRNPLARLSLGDQKHRFPAYPMCTQTPLHVTRKYAGPHRQTASEPHSASRRLYCTPGLCYACSQLSVPSCEKLKPPAPGCGQRRDTCRPPPLPSPCRGRRSCRCPSLGTGRLCHSALHLGILQPRHLRLQWTT